MYKFLSMAENRYRMIGLSVSILGIVIFIILRCLNYQYEGGWETRIFMINHYVIIFGLIMLTYSKENRDDERVQRIRYAVLKLTYVWTIIGISVYMVVTTLDRFQFNLYVIVYIIESVLLIFQLLFRIFLATNPEWVFRDSPPNRKSFFVLFVCLVFLMAWIVYVVINFRLI